LGRACRDECPRGAGGEASESNRPVLCVPAADPARAVRPRVRGAAGVGLREGTRHRATAARHAGHGHVATGLRSGRRRGRSGDGGNG
jgi:hypothetical protein